MHVQLQSWEQRAPPAHQPTRGRLAWGAGQAAHFPQPMPVPVLRLAVLPAMPAPPSPPGRSSKYRGEDRQAMSRGAPPVRQAVLPFAPSSPPALRSSTPPPNVGHLSAAVWECWLARSFEHPSASRAPRLPDSLGPLHSPARPLLGGSRSRRWELPASAVPVTVKEHSSGEEDPWADKLSGHQIRGWRAVSVARWHGQGSLKRNVVFFVSQAPASPQTLAQAGNSAAAMIPEERPPGLSTPPRFESCMPARSAWLFWLSFIGWSNDD